MFKLYSISNVLIIMCNSHFCEQFCKSWNVFEICYIVNFEKCISTICFCVWLKWWNRKDEISAKKEKGFGYNLGMYAQFKENLKL